ncbi:hypothetical protein LX36DRAFT_359636 [Colletotrichum falcatum]|nr:hypothetical protein LX36DRAFT_359636 [Colletotrichum falcatum]
MKLLYLVYLGAVASCIALHTSLDSSKLPQNTNILPRAKSEAYEAVQATTTTQLKPGAYYYFLNCKPPVPYDYYTRGQRYVKKQTGCIHVGLVFGYVTESGDDFEGDYLHVTASTEGFGNLFSKKEFSRVKWNQNLVKWKPNFRGQR